eukprot:UN06227
MVRILIIYVCFVVNVVIRIVITIIITLSIITNQIILHLHLHNTCRYMYDNKTPHVGSYWVLLL